MDASDENVEAAICECVAQADILRALKRVARDRREAVIWASMHLLQADRFAADEPAGEGEKEAAREAACS